jgi:hypothetical protein
MPLNKELVDRKLRELVESEGFETLEELLEACIADSVSPAICMAPDCDYTVEMEPDQRAGYCEACGRQTVRSALVLAGLI